MILRYKYPYTLLYHSSLYSYNHKFLTELPSNKNSKLYSILLYVISIVLLNKTNINFPNSDFLIPYILKHI